MNYRVKHITATYALGKTKLGRFQYVINPYLGCGHSCVYCYARYTIMRLGHKSTDWGKIVYPRIDIVQRLRDEIRYKKKGTVYLSSITDPYQPVEAKYGITRKILEVLRAYSWPVTILTKSILVERDVDILKNYPQSEVGVSLGVPPDIDRYFEPYASRVDARIKLLGRLAERLGVHRLYAFIAPMLPIPQLIEGYTEIIEQLEGLGIRRIYIDKLNIKSEIWKTINPVLDQLGINRRSFWKRAKSSAFWAKIKKLISKSINTNLELTFLF